MQRLLMLACVVSLFCLPLSTAEAKKPAAKAGKTAAAKPIVVCLTLAGEYPEGPAAPGVFAEIQPSLSTLVERINAAAADKSVLAVWLKIEDMTVGRGKLHELRAPWPGCGRRASRSTPN